MVIFTGTLLNLDGVPDSQGDIFDENTAIELPSHRVSVTLDFHKDPEFWLGTAKLFFRSNELCYTMWLDDTRLPKYALETLTPCMAGSTKDIGRGHRKDVRITSIGLFSISNCDPRIKSIGEQNENNDDLDPNSTVVLRS